MDSSATPTSFFLGLVGIKQARAPPQLQEPLSHFLEILSNFANAGDPTQPTHRGRI